MKKGAAQETDKPNKKGKWLEDIWIPEEIWETIFSHLPLSALGNAAQVSKQWHGFIQNVSRQWLTSYMPHLATHEDFPNAPLKLVIKEYLCYKAKFPSIPMKTILAALKGEVAEVCIQLSCILGLSDQPLTGDILLWVAVENNHIDIVRILLEKEYGISHYQKYRALKLAVKKGYAHVVNVFLEECREEITEDEKSRLQLLACEKGHLNVVHAFLKKLPNIFKINENFARALNTASEDVAIETVINLLKQPKTIAYHWQRGDALSASAESLEEEATNSDESSLSFSVD